MNYMFLPFRHYFAYAAACLSVIMCLPLSIFASTVLEAEVIKQYSAPCQQDTTQTCSFLDVQVFGDNQTLQTVTAQNNEYHLDFQPGSRVWISQEADGLYYVQLPKRMDQLVWIAGIFVLITILLIGRKGIRAIATLVGTTVFLIWGVLPLLVNAPDYFVLIGIGSVFVILACNILFGQGFYRQSYISLAGSMITLTLVGVLTTLFTQWTNTSGFGAENALVLQSDPATQGINPVHIFFVGTMIGIAGAIDDVTNAQALIVEETAKSEQGLWANYHQAMKLGSSHIISMINTLFLAYLGVGLTTVLLFQTNALADSNALFILSRDDFSEEIIRTLLASFAVVLAIPITTLLAVWVKKRFPR